MEHKFIGRWGQADMVTAISKDKIEAYPYLKLCNIL